MESTGWRLEDLLTVGTKTLEPITEINTDYLKANVDNDNIRKQGKDLAEIWKLLAEKAHAFCSKLKMAHTKMKFQLQQDATHSTGHTTTSGFWLSIQQ